MARSTLPLTKALCSAMSRQKPVDAFGLLQSVFTSKELELAEKRIRVALLLEQSVPYSKIQKQLKVSAATIASVSEQKKDSKFIKMVESVEKELARFTWFKRKN